MSSKRGRPLSVLKKQVEEICKDKRVVKAAKEELLSADVLVCGRCLQVFHFIHEFHEHKQIVPCTKPKLDPSLFSSSAKIWAFMLWKNSPQTKETFLDGISDDGVMWQHWSKLEENKRHTWMTAGVTLWELATVNQSDVGETSPSEFDKTHKKVTPVPLASLLRDPKLTSVSQVSLERVFLPEVDLEDPQTSSKRAQTLDLEETPPTRPKRAKIVAAAVEEEEEVVDDVIAEMEHEGEEGTQEYVVEAIVGKRFDRDSMSYLYEIKWEGFPSSQNTWEPEANLTHCKPMIEEFERKQKSPVDSNGKPIRSSKAKAIDKVKSWVGSAAKEKVTNWNYYDPNVKIKVEEKDPLDIDFEPESLGGCDSPSISNSSDDEHPAPQSKQYGGSQSKTTAAAASKGTPKSASTSTQPASKAGRGRPCILKKSPAKSTPVKPPPPPKYDPKASTLLVANSLGMVRVNAKALPDIKPGIYPVGKNEQLSRIKPLIPKVNNAPKSGLVVITNNPKVEKPGVRRKPLTQLTVNKTPTGKFQISTPQSNARQQQSKPLVTKQTNATAVSGSSTDGQSTTFTLPANPGNLPYLVMAPPGSSVGALLITPTPTISSTTESADTKAEESKDKATKQPDSQTGKADSTSSPTKNQDKEPLSNDKSDDSKTTDSVTNVGTNETSKENDDTNETPKETVDDESMDLSANNVSLAMEVSQPDSETETETETTDVLEKLMATLQDEKTEDKSQNINEKLAEESKKEDKENEIEPPKVSDVPKPVDESIKSPSPQVSPNKIDATSSITFEMTSRESLESLMMMPQSITIPEGVDPSSLQLPPNTQLMVADTGEYYLVPQQPEGSTIALAQDTTSGEVKMVALPAAGSQSGEVVEISTHLLSEGALNDQEVAPCDDAAAAALPVNDDDSKFFVVMPNGEYMLMSDSQVNQL